MKPITELKKIDRCGRLLRSMMSNQEGREFEFEPTWIQNHAWNVVPVESMCRIPPQDIARICSALSSVGYTACIAVLNEPGYVTGIPFAGVTASPDKTPTCYELAVTERELQEFNQRLGLFRSVLTTEDGAWAISCNETYNLFGGELKLLECLLGKPIDIARRDFLDFAVALSQSNSDETLLTVAKRY